MDAACSECESKIEMEDSCAERRRLFTRSGRRWRTRHSIRCPSDLAMDIIDGAVAHLAPQLIKEREKEGQSSSTVA